jgi:hypothetical protein
MLGFRCQRMLPVFVCLQLALPLSAAIAQEEGRGVRVQSEERRKADERRTEERFRQERRSTERPVTEIDRAARDVDITKMQNRKFLDANNLSDLIKENEAKWKVSQAIHSWSGHETEFMKIGIGSVDALKKHIEEIRLDPDIHIMLPRGRELYAKIDRGREGTIVIDNPNTENGGSAFRNSDVRRRADELSKE